MGVSDGLSRGLEVTNTGAPISIPVGEETLGRIMDVLGNPIDEKGPLMLRIKCRFIVNRRNMRIKKQETRF